MTIEVASEATQGCDATRRLARQKGTNRCIGVKLVDLVFPTSHVRKPSADVVFNGLCLHCWCTFQLDVTWVLGTCRYSDAMSDWWRRINKRPSRATDAAPAQEGTTLHHQGCKHHTRPPQIFWRGIPRGSFRVESTGTTTNLPAPSPPPPPPLLVASPSVVSLCQSHISQPCRHVSQHPKCPQRGPLQARLQQVSCCAQCPRSHQHPAASSFANMGGPSPAMIPKMAPSCETSTPAVPLHPLSRPLLAPMAATRLSSTTFRR